jgi:hypothetical protein
MKDETGLKGLWLAIACRKLYEESDCLDCDPHFHQTLHRGLDTLLDSGSMSGGPGTTE